MKWNREQFFLSRQLRVLGGEAGVGDGEDVASARLGPLWKMRLAEYVLTYTIFWCAVAKVQQVPPPFLTPPTF